MGAIDPWYLEHLVCPIEKTKLRFDGAFLVSRSKRRYPVVHGIPVMLATARDHTFWVARASLESAVRCREGDDADPLFLRTLGVSAAERQQIHESFVSEDSPIDPVVRYMVAQTCGHAYRSVIGTLRHYPVPELSLPAASGEFFLDIGCSWGRWSIAASDRGYVPIGIDPSLGAVLAASRIARELGTSARFLVADGRFLPFADESVDVVFSYSVLQHFSKGNVIRTLREVARVMQPGARSLIQMPNRLGVRSLYHQLRRGLRNPRDFEVRYWSLSELRRTFRELIGPSEIRPDCYLGLGLQKSDVLLMPPIARAAVWVSEVLKRVQRALPGLVRLADSVWVSSQRLAGSEQKGHRATDGSRSGRFARSGPRSESAHMPGMRKRPHGR